MSPQAVPNPGLGFNLNDVLFVLFRRKWLILGFLLVGVAGAVAVHLRMPVIYFSEAKLLVRYVLDDRFVNAMPSQDTQIRTPDSRGDNIINSEVEILRSRDLALLVADTVGPEKILASSVGGTNRYAAAGMVLGNLFVEVPKKSNVIYVRMGHPDPEMAPLILKELVNLYLRKHVEVHRSSELEDRYFEKRRDELKSSLREKDEDLRKLKAKAGVTTLEETRKSLADQITKIRQDIFNTEAELAEYQASAKVLGQNISPAPTSAHQTTNAPPDKISQYRSLVVQLNTLRNKEIEFQTVYTDSNPVLTQLRSQIAQADKVKLELEQTYPSLAILGSGLPGRDPALAAHDSVYDVRRIPALEARLVVLSNQLVSIRKDVANLDEMETSILELQRERERDENSYKYYLDKLSRAQIDDQIGQGANANINVLQQASAAMADVKKKQQLTLLALLFGLLGGVGLAFLLDLYLNPRIRRAREIELKFKVPLFMNIPRLNAKANGQVNGSLKGEGMLELPEHSEVGQAANQALTVRGATGNVPWSATHQLRPFFEALRDRVAMHFEGDPHKPKLVAITSGNVGAGVTTVASALAATLSETGDGNVLLVDMNMAQGAAHPFYRGRPGCGLNDILEGDRRQEAKVQENLFVVRAQETSGGQVNAIVPKQVSKLMPKLMASDYDYIIFDMPPVSQTSITPRLAHLMDMVLFIVEADKSNRDTVGRALNTLTGGKAEVATILNKSQRVLPRALDSEG